MLQDTDSALRAKLAEIERIRDEITQAFDEWRQAQQKAQYFARQQAEHAAIAARSQARRQGRQAQEIARQSVQQTIQRAEVYGRGVVQEIAHQAEAEAQGNVRALVAQAQREARAMAIRQAERVRQQETERRRREREEARRAWEVSTPAERAWYDGMMGALAYNAMTEQERLALYRKRRQGRR